MAAKKIDIELGGEAAIRVLDDLEARALRLQGTLQGLAGILGSGGGSPTDRAQFFGTLEQLSGVQGAINAARSSVAAGTAISSQSLVNGAANGTAAFGANVRNRQIADPQGILNMAQAAGVSGNALGAVVQSLAGGSVPYVSGSSSSAAVVAQVVQSVQRQQANPFAVMQTSGPSLPINGPGMSAPQGPYSQVGNPGYNANAYYFQQEQQRLTQQQQKRTVGVGLGVQTLSGGANLIAQNTLSGELDPMAAAQFWGSAAGGITGFAAGTAIGAAAPVPEPGLGALIGSQLGREAGGALAAYAMAPFVRTRNAIMAVQSVATRAGANPYSLVTGKVPGGLLEGDGYFPGGGLEGISDRVTYRGKSAADKAAIRMGTYTGTDVMSPLKAAQTFSTLGSALLEAGDQPILGLGMTETLGNKFGMGAQTMAGIAAPVLAAHNKLGNNRADMFLQFGPEAFGAYTDLTNTAGITPRQMGNYRDLQSAQYQASIAALQARGSGTATLAALQQQMASIAKLPDGSSSRAYAEAAAQARDAGRLKFEQDDIGKYGIPMAHLAGERERLNVLPFSPGNRFSNDLRTIALSNKEIKRVSSYMAARRSSGQLSEQEELSLTERLEGLETSKAYGIASLSSGMENRLPALSAGKGRRFDVFNSVQLAQLALYKVHSPIRDFGSINGQQAQEQNDFLNGFNLRLSGPHSRTQGLNNAGSSDRVESLLERIANALERGGGNPIGRGARPGEVAGAAAGALAQRNPGQGLNGKAN